MFDLRVSNWWFQRGLWLADGITLKPGLPGSFKRIGRVDDGISKSVNCRKCRHKYQEPTIQTVLRFGPYFSDSLKIVAKQSFLLFLGESKIKIGSQTEWKKPLLFIDFFLYFHFVFLWMKKVFGVPHEPKTLFCSSSISRNIDLHPFF